MPAIKRLKLHSEVSNSVVKFSSMNYKFHSDLFMIFCLQELSNSEYEEMSEDELLSTTGQE